MLINGVFADELINVRSYWVVVALNPILTRAQRLAETQRNCWAGEEMGVSAQVMMWAEVSTKQLEAKESQAKKTTIFRTRKALPLEPSEEA